MDDELRVLRTFNTEAEAYLARAILEAGGIASAMTSAGGMTLQPILGIERGTSLSVRVEDLEAARELLGEE